MTEDNDTTKNVPNNASQSLASPQKRAQDQKILDNLNLVMRGDYMKSDNLEWRMAHATEEHLSHVSAFVAGGNTRKLLTSIYGIPVVLREDIPPHTIQFHADGKIVAIVANVGTS